MFPLGKQQESLPGLYKSCAARLNSRPDTSQFFGEWFAARRKRQNGNEGWQRGLATLGPCRMNWNFAATLKPLSKS
jgi:hypothetical protein